jgi:hypothetical protein
VGAVSFSGANGLRAGRAILRRCLGTYDR